MPQPRAFFRVIIAAGFAAAGLSPLAAKATADQEYSADELKAAAEEQQIQIGRAQSALRDTKLQLSQAIKAKNLQDARVARAQITNLERAIRELRKRDLNSFAQERREAAEREEAEKRAQEAARMEQQAADEARMEVMRRPKIQPDSMKQGDQGFFQSNSGEEYYLQVAFVREGGRGVLAKVYGEGTCVFVEGIAIDGLTSDRWFSLPQQMKVVGTDNCLADGREVTYFVLTPLDPGSTAVDMRDAPPRPLPPLSNQRVPIRLP